MIQYLIDLIDKIEAEQRRSRLPGPDYQTEVTLIEEFSKEVDRLDPRDFAPAVQCEFVVLRAQLKASASEWVRLYTPDGGPFKRLRRILQFYGGPNGQVKSRSFAYVSDDELRKIVERDYRELSLLVFSASGWKSSVILAGSILEALLYDALTLDLETAAKANAARSAPKFKGKVKPIESGDWRLAELIDVASELQILPTERAKTIDQVLRDYRNFVYPKKEIRLSMLVRKLKRYWLRVRWRAYAITLTIFIQPLATGPRRCNCASIALIRGSLLIT
jgi:hypothetical protein